MKNFLKGIVVGIGGIAPGLSGCVLLIIFGLYQKTLDAFGHFFKDIMKNGRFLLPLILGMAVGVLLFSKIIDFFIGNYEMPTRFCFLGLILGTVPMVWKEVREKGCKWYHYVCMVLSAAFGFWLFRANPHLFPEVTDPNVLQSILLGIAVGLTAVIPGFDPTVVLTTLGIYRMYVSALADFDVSVLAPMLIGLAISLVAISRFMTFLFKRFYTATYSVIFGIFISMIPNMLNKNCVLGFNLSSAISIILLAAGFFVSYILGKKREN
ncbi:MAG: DUF368 domain-containing protein [Oscillospiraceae bacterium]|nr:DUF368 domain-containing protein [Oscillospiraceae bacterium]